MKQAKLKVFGSVVAALVLCCAVLVAAGCSGVSQAVSKLNDRLTEVGSAASQLPSNLVRDPQTTISSTGDATVTVLVYMNGSNLETEAGEATDDIAEMISAGTSDKVNVLIQTMGTKQWQKYNISSSHTQRYKVENGGLTLVDNTLDQMPCTEANTLSSFIEWGAKNYPADRYELIFWNHGGGPVYGFGYDETGDTEDALTIDEMQAALSKGGVYFDFIGMDCCIMSSIETCMALYDFCDYTILSEDFESGLGWQYSSWLRKLMEDTTISTKDLGTLIVDDMVNANKNDRVSGDEAILALIDESMMKVLFTTWTEFAYANQDTLLGTNYSTTVSRVAGGRESMLLHHKGLFSDWLDASLSLFDSNWYSDSMQSYGTGNSMGWDYSDFFGGIADASMGDYYVTDIMATAQNINSAESQALSAAVANAIVYTNSTSGDSELTGLSVTLPYGDSEFYAQLKTVFGNCGIDADYIAWLGGFVNASGTYNQYDYSSWANLWNGWDSYNSSYDWGSWLDSYGDAANYNSYGWDQYSYEDSWNYWYLDNAESFAPDDSYYGGYIYGYRN
ncbi:MAG: clostripain-related cysteine peptidase [Coriobacteriia bacterium]|nr:clostripain-related cysteine peptidase [Coriobacteriia bacterium]